MSPTFLVQNLFAKIRFLPKRGSLKKGSLACLRGGKYFTHLEAGRVVRLAARRMEMAHTSTKNGFLLGGR